MIKESLFILILFSFISIGFSINYTNCNSTVPSGIHYLENDVYDNDGGNCFTLNQDNIIFDCNGYKISDNSSANNGITIGILKTNVTIRNCVIQNFDYGVYINVADENFVKDSIFFNNTYSFFLTNADNNLIDNITILGPSGNIRLEWTSSNNVFSNINLPNGYLFLFDQTSNNTFQDSTLNAISFQTPFSNTMSDNNFFNNHLGNFSSITPDWSKVLNSNFTGNYFLEGTVPNPPCFPPQNTTCDYSYQNYSISNEQIQSTSSNIFPIQSLTSILLAITLLLSYFIIN